MASSFVLPDDVEERFGVPELPSAAEAVSVYLGVRVADEVVRALVSLTIGRLRTKTKRERSGVLYGPNEEVLSRFEIPRELAVQLGHEDDLQIPEGTETRQLASGETVTTL